MNLKQVSCTWAAAAMLLGSTMVYGQADSTMQPSTNTAGSAAMDKKFLHNAAEGGYAEIQLGQLASQKASSDGVKQFGQRMVTDHTQLNADLQPFAEAQGVAAPTALNAKDQALYNRLNALSGPSFDKAYMNAMVKDHHEDMREFNAEIKTTSNAQLKAAVQKGAAVIREHTSMAEQLAKSTGGATSSSGQ